MSKPPKKPSAPRKKMPQAPHGIRGDMWLDRQAYLLAKDVPWDVVAGITTLKRMNLFLMAESFPTSIYFKPDWRWVLKNEHNPKELNKLLIWRDDRLRKGNQ